MGTVAKCRLAEHGGHSERGHSELGKDDSLEWHVQIMASDRKLEQALVARRLSEKGFNTYMSAHVQSMLSGGGEA